MHMHTIQLLHSLSFRLVFLTGEEDEIEENVTTLLNYAKVSTYTHVQNKQPLSHHHLRGNSTPVTFSTLVIIICQYHTVHHTYNLVFMQPFDIIVRM